METTILYSENESMSKQIDELFHFLFDNNIAESIGTHGGVIGEAIFQMKRLVEEKNAIGEICFEAGRRKNILDGFVFEDYKDYVNNVTETTSESETEDSNIVSRQLENAEIELRILRKRNKYTNK